MKGGRARWSGKHLASDCGVVEVSSRTRKQLGKEEAVSCPFNVNTAFLGKDAILPESCSGRYSVKKNVEVLAGSLWGKCSL